MPMIKTVIHKPTLTQRAYATLKEAIVSCELLPGTRVSEEWLSEQMQLGRAATRMALGRLCQDGLVEALPRIGHVIAPITISRCKELFGMRKIIEPAAVEEASRKGVDVDALGAISAKCEAVEVIPGDRLTIERFLTAYRQFHLEVLRPIENQRLVDLMEGVFDEMERMMHVGLMVKDRSFEIHIEHRELVAALALPDPMRARDLSRRAIEHAERMVIDALMDSPSIRDVNIEYRTLSGSDPEGSAGLGDSG